MVLVVLAIAAIAVMAKTGLLKKLLAGPAAPTLPYRKAEYLLSKAERSFFEVLLGAIGPDLLVFPKVRMLDLVYLPKGTENAQSHRNKVQSKHLDFVLCRRDTVSPVLVIELNDRSHNRRDRQERDAFVKHVLDTIGLPYMPVPAKRAYDQRTLAAQVQAKLAGPDEPAKETVNESH
jgi:hypothetical protein